MDAELLSSMLDDGYFSKPPPKSTGRETFNLAWLESFLTANKHNVQFSIDVYSYKY